MKKTLPKTQPYARPPRQKTGPYLRIGERRTDTDAGARRDLLRRGRKVTLLDKFEGSVNHGFSASLTPETTTVMKLSYRCHALQCLNNQFDYLFTITALTQLRQDHLKDRF